MNNEPCEFLPVKDWNEKPEPRFCGFTPTFIIGILVGMLISVLLVALTMLLM